MYGPLTRRWEIRYKIEAMTTCSVVNTLYTGPPKDHHAPYKINTRLSTMGRYCVDNYPITCQASSAVAGSPCNHAPRRTSLLELAPWIRSRRCSVISC